MDHLLELETAMARIVVLASGAQGDEPVPACPGWNVRDVVEHLGTVHRWASAIVLSGQRLELPRTLIGEPLAEWYAGTAAALVAALRAVDPDEIVPNFSRVDETAAFWPRRQMHETTVHGVDVAQALGIDESDWRVHPVIAGDGIDEVVRIFFPRMTARGERPDVRSRVRLVATDLGQSWVIAPGEGTGAPVSLDPGHEADAEVRGLASDLYLGLWHRVSRDALEFDGEDGLSLFDGPTTP